MKTYHILYKDNSTDTTIKGENFKVYWHMLQSVVEALKQFKEKYPEAIFVGLYDVNEIAILNINTQAIREAAEVDDVIRMNRENMIDDERDMTSLQF